jgi:hypothetical protein
LIGELGEAGVGIAGLDRAFLQDFLVGRPDLQAVAHIALEGGLVGARHALVLRPLFLAALLVLRGLGARARLHERPQGLCLAAAGNGSTCSTSQPRSAVA